MPRFASKPCESRSEADASSSHSRPLQVISHPKGLLVLRTRLSTTMRRHACRISMVHFGSFFACPMSFSSRSDSGLFILSLSRWTPRTDLTHQHRTAVGPENRQNQVAAKVILRRRFHTQLPPFAFEVFSPYQFLLAQCLCLCNGTKSKAESTILCIIDRSPISSWISWSKVLN
jgi:hypothetical protein